MFGGWRGLRRFWAIVLLAVLTTAGALQLAGPPRPRSPVVVAAKPVEHPPAVHEPAVVHQTPAAAPKTAHPNVGFFPRHRFLKVKNPNFRRGTGYKPSKAIPAAAPAVFIRSESLVQPHQRFLFVRNRWCGRTTSFSNSAALGLKSKATL